ncbi:MAG: LLM class F420-dependent oxidoreductase [Alphaproteobacteria bacterium]|nr:LLM class F420-dependent oxidoreductase [Alphaproteobacteria bacterium]
MRLGVAFPTTEIGNDPAVIGEFARAVEDAGYDHLTCIDHVLGAGTAKDEWRAYYTRANAFHEVLVLFGFMAALTKRIELASAVLILPQRQTALVAKQAAEIDVLSRGRLRLGVGLGWNEIEYEALNENFRNRARRFEEQIVLLRRLWTEDLVTFNGTYHKLNDVGINPVPVRRAIPLWVGAFDPKAVERAGRIADGWFVNPRIPPGNEASDAIETFRKGARSVGRDPAKLGIDATVHIGGKTPAECVAEAEAWRRLGATHLTVRTMYAGLDTPAQHIEAIRRIRAALPPA